MAQGAQEVERECDIDEWEDEEAGCSRPVQPAELRLAQCLQATNVRSMGTNRSSRGRGPHSCLHCGASDTRAVNVWPGQPELPDGKRAERLARKLDAVSFIIRDSLSLGINVSHQRNRWTSLSEYILSCHKSSTKSPRRIYPCWMIKLL